MTERLRKLHNEELPNTYCSLNIMQIMNWRRVKWVKRVTRKEEIGRVYEILVENNLEKSLEVFVLYGRTI